MKNQSNHNCVNHHDKPTHNSHMHHGHMLNDFRRRFWVSLVFSVPVLLLSPMLQSLLGFHLSFQGDSYVLFGFSSFVFFYGGYPFLKGLKQEVRKGTPGMMTLIGVAISVAYLYSSLIVVGLPGKMFFWELVTLVDIMLLGHWMEMKSVLGASRSLELLVQMLPSEAHKLVGDQIVDVPLQDLRKGDIILIKPGEKIPADGVIVEGESYVNESMLTGESIPVKKKKNDQVIGGSVNGNGSLKVRVEYTGEESYLSRVISLVEEAQKTKSQTQRLADKAAKWLTFVSLAVGIVTFLTWSVLGSDVAFALERMVTVMVIACPHALGLAIPLVVAISTTICAKNGLLIRNRTAFENARKITVLVFDKTGTLTKGEFGVSRIIPLNPDWSEDQILAYAASIEHHSEHPIAQGIVKAAKERQLTLLQVEHFQAIPGKGIKGIINGKEFLVVSPGYLKENQISIPERIDKDDYAETMVFVLQENVPVGFIGLADEIRPESFQAILQLKAMKIRVIMATGDHQKVAESIAKKLQLDEFYAEVLPHKKVEIVKQFQHRGEFVAMTGDGVNDAPALAQADIGIAVGSGTDIAAETADIILVRSNPMDILNLIRFGRATYQKMIQNLVWATGYNVFAIPLAAGILSPWNIVLSPALGAILMSLSTIIVALNASRLKNVARF